MLEERGVGIIWRYFFVNNLEAEFPMGSLRRVMRRVIIKKMKQTVVQMRSQKAKKTRGVHVRRHKRIA